MGGHHDHDAAAGEAARDDASAGGAANDGAGGHQPHRQREPRAAGSGVHGSNAAGPEDDDDVGLDDIIEQFLSQGHPL